jgi:prepilin-type N-terminal cleavage/methylation domain-containing protein
LNVLLGGGGTASAVAAVRPATAVVVKAMARVFEASIICVPLGLIPEKTLTRGEPLGKTRLPTIKRHTPAVDTDSMRARANARLRGQGGFTLIELLVATAIFLILLGAVLALLSSSTKVSAQDQERTHAIRDTQVGVYEMTRELRQAYSLVQTTPHKIEVHVWQAGADHDVTYDCTGTSTAGPPLGQCVRFETTASGQTPATTVVDRLVNGPSSGRPPVFSYDLNGSGQTTYARVHVETPAKGERGQGYAYRVVFDDGFFMRNLND